MKVLLLLCAVFFIFNLSDLNAQTQERSVQVLKVHGIINTGTVKYLARGIDQAQKENAALVTVVLDTPGGLLTSTREIVQLMNQSKVPVAIYISPSGASATSAGTILAMAAAYSAMAPGTNIGAAHPVGGQGEDIKGEMNEKAVNDTVGLIKAQAAQHGRNQDWAEQAIRKSVSVTADEAVKLNVVDYLAEDLTAFLQKIDKEISVSDLPRKEIEKTTAERLLTFLGDPNVSYLLMLLGGLGIYIELSSPGAVLPGVVGAIALILSFVSFSTLPVNYGGLALLILGLILFVLEAFITSFGALTIGGIVSVVLGAIFLMDQSTGDLKISLAVLVPSVLAFAVISTGMAYVLFKSRKVTYSGLTDFSGYTGTIQSVEADGLSGKVFIRGEVWNFDSREPMKIGESVQVTGQERFHLIVKRRA